MSKKSLNEAGFLSLLEKVLPVATEDAQLASSIYEKVAKEIRLITSLNALQSFCEKGSLPDAETATVTAFREQLEGNFGKENVDVTPAEEESKIYVEIHLPDRTWNGSVVVQPPGKEEGDAEAPFVPFPAALPEDPELVWLLARKENLGPDEASRALANIANEFWESKKGQNLQRQGVEKSFAEFISNVPAAALKESGIKRYHKDPETLHLHKPLTPSE